MPATSSVGIKHSLCNSAFNRVEFKVKTISVPDKWTADYLYFLIELFSWCKWRQPVSKPGFALPAIYHQVAYFLK